MRSLRGHCVPQVRVSAHAYLFRFPCVCSAPLPHRLQRVPFLFPSLLFISRKRTGVMLCGRSRYANNGNFPHPLPLLSYGEEDEEGVLCAAMA